MTVLLLRLAGPMQSWGSSSRFARRGTEREPTKSGVVGMVASAQGRRRHDSIEDLLGLTFGVRVDQEGRLIQDFQTARTAEGKPMPLTRRYYLSDAVFVAGLEGERELMEGLWQAVRQPAFAPYLGRRSCPPSGPIALSLSDATLDQALAETPWQAAEWYQRKARGRRVHLRVRRDARGAGRGETMRDAPVSFDPRDRQYGWRTVIDLPPIEVSNPFGRVDDHDPLAELGG